MNHERQAAARHSATRLANGCALATIFLGAFAMAGWYVGGEPLRILTAGFTPARFNTALAMVLAGAALRWREHPPIRVTLGLLVVMIGATTFTQDLTGRDFGIDELFVRESLGAQPPDQLPGRMSPLSSMCCILSGAALVLGVFRRFGAALADALSVATGALAIISLIAYAAGLDGLIGLSGVTPMSFQAATMFVLISVGVLSAESEGTLALVLRSRGAGRMLWMGFGLVTSLLTLIGIVSASRLRAISADVDHQGTVALARTIHVRNLKAAVLNQSLAVRSTLLGDPEARKDLVQAGWAISAHLQGYRELAQTVEQKAMGERFEELWRQMDEWDASLIPAGKASPAELGERTNQRKLLVGLIDNEMLPEAIAAYDLSAATTKNTLRGTQALIVWLLVAGVLIALVTGGAVGRAVVEKNEALVESEEKFRSLFDGSMDAIFSLSSDGKFVSANPAAQRAAGRTLTELQQMNFLDFCVPENRNQATNAFRAAFCKECLTVEVAITNAAGERRDLLIAGAPAIVDGKVIGVSCIARDFTERKASDLMMRKVLRQARTIVMESIVSAPDNWRDLPEGTPGLFHYNSKFDEAAALDVLPFDLATGESFTSHWFNFRHPEDNKVMAHNARRAFLTRASHYYNEFRVRDRNDRWRWFSQVCAVEPLAENKWKVMAINTDITERKLAEEALQENQRRLSGIVESAMDAIITIDEDQLIILFNSAAERMFLCKAEEAIGSELDRFIPERFRKIHQAHVEKFGASGMLSREMGPHGALYGLRSNGEEFPIEASISMIEMEDQQLYTVILRDITARKANEEALRQLTTDLEHRVQERTAQLSESNQELESFAYSISHDLRTPLRAVNGFARILINEHGTKLDEEGRRVAGVISGEAQRMGLLIDALLNFSRLGRQPLKTSHVDVKQLATDSIEEAKSGATDRQVEFRIGDLPPASADPTLLRQVFVNLFSNAVKFTRDANPAIIEAGSETREGETVYWVRDNGAGFNPSHSGKLFGVFQRLHRQDEFEGTGVGLAFTQRIVHRHHGRIWAESQLGEGATFYFTLPSPSNGWGA